MRIQVSLGDITHSTLDAVVNAANSSLLGGGGVDGAIHRAAGPGLLTACRHLRSTVLPGGLPPGQAVATPGFDLPARWVIHTVGPNRHAGQVDPAVLQGCYRSSLELAERIEARSVAFPAVGAGVYGWTATESASAARSALVDGPLAGPAAGPADVAAAGPAAGDAGAHGGPGAYEGGAAHEDVAAHEGGAFTRSGVPGTDAGTGTGTGTERSELDALWPGIDLVEFVTFTPQAHRAFSEVLHDLL